MVQEGQKQEGMSCGEVRAVCGFHTQGYCTISLHLYIVFIDTNIEARQRRASLLVAREA